MSRTLHISWKSRYRFQGEQERVCIQQTQRAGLAFRGLFSGTDVGSCVLLERFTVGNFLPLVKVTEHWRVGTEASGRLGVSTVHHSLLHMEFNNKVFFY